MPDEDIFWGRCSIKTEEEIKASPFVYDSELPQPHWRDDNTCSHCGGIRPSIALESIKAGAEVGPTDKSYKFYLENIPPNLSHKFAGCPAKKCYFNHFSESQAVEFVTLIETDRMTIGYPGKFYSGICFERYGSAIKKVLEKLKNEQR